MGSKLSGLKGALYDSKRREFLGRDGARWAKLGVFYFFFYLGLAGFFCAMLAVFMALSPRDRPRYYLDSSRMTTRSHPLSPGLGFRPQPDVDKNLIMIDKNAPKNDVSPYATNLDQYLNVFYWQHDPVKEQESSEEKPHDVEKFTIRNPGNCTNANQYGYSTGRPCVLVKMNKIVGFQPKPGPSSHDKEAFNDANCQKSNAIKIQCIGEYPADVDNIGHIEYISENDHHKPCGELETKWFPYKGKYNRKDYYQAPYIWVQFTNPKPNVLINVLCRVFGQNIEFDKKTGRALTRFQIYVKDISQSVSSGKTGNM